MTAEQIKVCRSAVPHDPLACVLRSFYDHVHTMCVGGEVAEIYNHFAAYRMALQAEQLSVMGSGIGFLLDLRKVIVQMRSKIVSGAGVRKKKNRAYAVFIEIKARGHSACARERHHPTLIRAHQRSFSGGQRNIER